MLQRNFIVQQGFEEPPVNTCAARYGALQFQPRVVAVILAAGILTQSPEVFSTLGCLLLLSALVPKFNPFEVVYNATLGRRPGAERLFPAPAPRRFSQGLAAAFCFVITFALVNGWKVLGWVMQGLMATAILALVLAGFCLGSMVFHMARGRVKFALDTLPWRQP